MAQQVKVIIDMEGGKILRRCTYLKLDQDLFDHHRFELHVPYDELEDEQGLFMQAAQRNVCGKSVSLSFSSVDGKKTFGFRFKGIVTELVLSHPSDFTHEFIIKGGSPTLLMEDCSLKRSFLKKSLGQIFDVVLKSYPGNVLKTKGRPNNKNIRPFTVQYGETNFAFLSRLSAAHGEWMYYNGQELIMGNPPVEKEVEFLIDGNQSFDFSVSMAPMKFSLHNYDYSKDRKYSSDASSVSVEGLGKMSLFAVEESANIFTQQHIIQSMEVVGSQQVLDDFTKYRKASAVGGLVVFSGKGEIPDINLGSVVSVSASRPNKGGRGKQEDLGKYRVIQLAHLVNRKGNYTVQFTAIPDSVHFPPENRLITQPAGKPELAVVTDNNDPDKMSRVKLSFGWEGGDSESDWVRVGSFYSGGGDRLGVQFIPEKDAQVMVGFEHGNPEFPFVLTSLYPRKEGMRARKGNNDEKLIYTRGGNIIALSDTEGNNNISISHVRNDATAIVLEFKENGTILLKTKGNINLEAGENISISAKDKLSVSAGTVEISATNELDIKGNSISLKADSGAEVTANTSITLHGTTAELSGDAVTTIKGGLVKIN